MPRRPIFRFYQRYNPVRPGLDGIPFLGFTWLADAGNLRLRPAGLDCWRGTLRLAWFAVLKSIGFAAAGGLWFAFGYTQLNRAAHAGGVLGWSLTAMFGLLALMGIAMVAGGLALFINCFVARCRIEVGGNTVKVDEWLRFRRHTMAVPLGEYLGVAALRRGVVTPPNDRSRRLVDILALIHPDATATVPLAVGDAGILPLRFAYAEAFGLPLLEGTVSASDTKRSLGPMPTGLQHRFAGNNDVFVPDHRPADSLTPPFRPGRAVRRVTLIVVLLGVGLGAIGSRSVVFAAGFAVLLGGAVLIAGSFIQATIAALRHRLRRLRRWRRDPHTLTLARDHIDIRQPSGDIRLPLADIVSVTVMPLNEEGWPEACLRLMTKDRCIELFRGVPVAALQWLRNVVAARVARCMT